MITAAWHDLSTLLATRSRKWVQRRQGLDHGIAHLHSRRIYIVPTRAGIVYGGVVGILLIASMNFSNNMGFALTFLLTGIGIINMHHCHRNLAGLRARLHKTESGFAGEQVCFFLHLENPANYDRWHLTVGWDYADTNYVRIAARSAATIALPLQAPQRGLIAAPRINVSTTFPLGLFRAWSWLHMDTTAIVWPKPVEHADRSAAAGTDNCAMHTVMQSGDDLSGVREYREGDSPRRIDWKALAHYGELLVREYHDGNTSNLWLDWDALPDMDTEARLAILARLALDADAAGSQWGLRLPELTVQPDSGAIHLHRCLDAMALHGISAPLTSAGTS